VRGGLETAVCSIHETTGKLIHYCTPEVFLNMTSQTSDHDLVPKNEYPDQELAPFIENSISSSPNIMSFVSIVS